MAKTMRPGYKEVEQNEGRRYSKEAWRDEKLARTPLPESNIPPRASAHPSAIATVRSKYARRFTDLERATHIDVTRLPTLPQQSETVGAAVRGHSGPTSLTGLEVSQQRIDDFLTDHIFHNIEGIVSIDEIDTLPPDVQARLRPRLSRLKRAAYELSTLSEVDTSSDLSIQLEPEIVSLVEAQQLVIMQPRKFFIRRIFDNIRWWLLYPGRLEFLLWLIGIIILICVTGLFVLVATASMGLFGFGGTQSITASDANMQKSTCVVTRAGTIVSKTGKECLSITALSSSGLQVTIMNGVVVTSGSSLEIQGDGFSPHSAIHITHDGDHPCEPAQTQADIHGEFSMTIRLMDKVEWSPGSHQITLYDVQSHHSITLPIMLTSAS